MRYGFLFLLIITTTLISCGDDKKAESAASTTQVPSTETKVDKAIDQSKSASKESKNAVPGRPEYDPVSPEIAPLPAHMAFDPCSLLTSEFAQTLNIPLDQRIERVGGTRKIPEDHRYTPYVGCIWRSVTQGVPRVAVEVQYGAENLNVNGEQLAGLGDAAWFGERRGRSELRMHLNDYVIFVRAELPHDQLSTQQVHEAVAKQLIESLASAPSGPQIPLDAGIFGGPEMDVCQAVKASGIADLLAGPKVWTFPTGAVNHIPDEQNKKPDADYVGCTFAGTTRGAVELRFLGPHGVKRQFGLYNKQTPVTINGIEGFRRRNGVYLPYGSGAFELFETMTPFDDALLPEKLESIMNKILTMVSQ